MKSDYEFLNGVYKKAEELKAELEAEKHIPEEANQITEEKQIREKQISAKANYDFNALESSFSKKKKSHKGITRYAKYTGMAAGFILLLSSTIYFVKLQGDNGSIDIPNPHGVKIINFSDQILEQATDIVEINVKDHNGVLQQEVTKVYKDSGNEVLITEFFQSNKIGLLAGDIAVAFLKVDTNVAVLMEIFIKAEDNTYVNPFGDVLTEEKLNELSE